MYKYLFKYLGKLSRIQILQPCLGANGIFIISFHRCPETSSVDESITPDFPKRKIYINATVKVNCFIFYYLPVLGTWVYL
jgi:hypothetical protein